MRHFSFRPSLTLSGRSFKGPRGWAGKPLHPPLTDVPIGAYVLAAAFDLVSLVASGEPWARDLHRAATFALVAGLAVAVLAAITGYGDRLRSTEAGNQARRTVNAHALMMVLSTILVVLAVVIRLSGHRDATSTSPLLFVLSAVIFLVTAIGATIGGTLVFDYGFNVETAGDHPVWHRSESDVLPGDQT